MSLSGTLAYFIFLRQRHHLVYRGRDCREGKSFLGVDLNNGPARVLGGAGTGKTVVAMHRARHLARLFPDQKILFTTFNRNLASNIATIVKK